MNSVSIAKRPSARATATTEAISSELARDKRPTRQSYEIGEVRHKRGNPTAVVGFTPMIFSSKAEYGVRLMVELGRQTPEQPTSLKAIADAEGLPLAYLEQVVARLRKADLVMSARGAHGGYWLARDAADITMYDVVG